MAKLNKRDAARLKYLSKESDEDKRTTFDPRDYKYRANPYDCQICYYYGGITKYGTVRCRRGERCEYTGSRNF